MSLLGARSLGRGRDRRHAATATDVRNFVGSW